MTRRRVVLPLALAVLAPVLFAPARADFSLFGDYYDNIPRAVAKGDVAAVQRLLADGTTPQQVDENDRTGLHIAAITGNLQIFALLVKAGAHLDAQDPLGNTPLHYAAAGNQIEMVRLMLALHAQIDPQNKQGLTPLMMAAAHGNVEVVQTLLEAGASASKTDFTGRDAVGWARDSRKPNLVSIIERAAAKKPR